VFAATVGCQGPQSQAVDQKLTVAVSIIPQGWLVRQVGGQHVDVVTLVGPGESHETFQPSDAQVSRLMQAAAYFRVGIPAEHGQWFEAIRASGRVKIVDTRQGVPMLEMSDHHHHDGAETAEQHHDSEEEKYAGKDPHIWLSPQALRIQAQTVVATLVDLDPGHAAEYRRNLKALQGQLDHLDAQLRQRLQPVKGKVLFLYHPAWGYFTHDYGLRQVAVEQDGKEPSDEQLTRLQQEAKADGVKTIFVQPQISSQAAEALASAIGGQVKAIDPLAADVPANLLHVAELIAQSYQ
jgi:zinc transport system substrate-binding protein